MEVWVGLATVLVGALATGILTYVNVRSRARRERTVVDLVRIRDLRRPYYQRLFEISRMICRVPDDATGWRGDARGVAFALENWYFVDGAGMFLGDEAKARFFELLGALEAATGSSEPPQSVAEDAARHICELAGQLRTQLAVDMTVVGGDATQPAEGR